MPTVPSTKDDEDYEDIPSHQSPRASCHKLRAGLRTGLLVRVPPRTRTTAAVVTLAANMRSVIRVDVGDVVAVGLVVVIVNGRHIERGHQCSRLQLSHQTPPHTRSHGRTIAISSQSS